MISAQNIINLMQKPSATIEPMRFVALPRHLQLAMLEWMEVSEAGWNDVLANTIIVGRSTALWHMERGELLNERALTRTLSQADRRLPKLRLVLSEIGVLDRPCARQCLVGGASLQLVVLPIAVDGATVYAATVAGW